MSLGLSSPKIPAYILSNTGLTIAACMSSSATVLKRSMSARLGILSVTSP